MKKTIKYGVIGTGLMGCEHISNIELIEGAEIIAICDTNKKVSDLYGMIHPNASDTLTVRTVFIIGPDKKIKLLTM